MTITPVAALVSAAKARITTLDVDEVRRRVDAGAARLVDIRDVREVQRSGRIPGAFHAPRGMLEFWVDPACPYHKPELSGEVPLILYCASAQRSALATAALLDMGMTDVAEMAGGFAGWVACGGAVEMP